MTLASKGRFVSRHGSTPAAIAADGFMADDFLVAVVLPRLALILNLQHRRRCMMIANKLVSSGRLRTIARFLARVSVDSLRDKRRLAASHRDETITWLQAYCLVPVHGHYDPAKVLILLFVQWLIERNSFGKDVSQVSLDRLLLQISRENSK